MSSDLRLSLAIPQWGIDLGLMLLVGVFFGLIGPFGTDAAPLGPRLAYWMSVMPAGGICVLLAEGLLARAGQALPRLANLVAVALLAALPQTVVVFLAGGLILGFTHPEGLSFGQTLMSFTSSYTAVAIVMFAMVPLIRLARHQLPLNSAASPKPESAAILQRLSFPLRKSTLIALQAEDHYVRIHTQAGSELVLMRLGDAIAETSPLAGYRTHRSWWVAAASVERAQFKRGSGRVTLTGGLEAPISRSHVDSLREAGILS